MDDYKILYAKDGALCLTPCVVKVCKVGSIACQKCDNLIEYNKEHTYVECKEFYAVKNKLNNFN